MRKITRREKLEKYYTDSPSSTYGRKRKWLDSHTIQVPAGFDRTRPKVGECCGDKLCFEGGGVLYCTNCKKEMPVTYPPKFVLVHPFGFQVANKPWRSS